jgi:hypothetical protein
MPDGQQLQRTSDVLLAQLSELEDLEQQKRSLPDGSKAQLRLSRQVESLARKVLRVAGEQTEIVETIAEMSDAATGSQSLPRESHLILADWRAAERALDEQTPGTPGWESARTDVERLRAEYQRAFRIKGDRPGA